MDGYDSATYGDRIAGIYDSAVALLDQDAQVRCFQRVAAHLSAGGAFVVEAFVPDLARFSGGQHTSARVR